MKLETRLEVIRLINELKAKGYIKCGTESHTKYRFHQIIQDPLNFNPPAQYVTIGVSRLGKGGRKYSCIDFFGFKIDNERYWVADFERFKAYIRPRLIRKFKAHNPNPSQGLRTAFTHFLNDYNFSQ